MIQRRLCLLFLREYKEMMNDDYPVSYTDLMSENPSFYR